MNDVLIFGVDVKILKGEETCMSEQGTIMKKKGEFENISPCQRSGL